MKSGCKSQNYEEHENRKWIMVFAQKGLVKSTSYTFENSFTVKMIGKKTLWPKIIEIYHYLSSYRYTYIFSRSFSLKYTWMYADISPHIRVCFHEVEWGKKAWLVVVGEQKIIQSFARTRTVTFSLILFDIVHTVSLQWVENIFIFA